MVGFVFLNVIGGSKGPKRPRPLLLATQKKKWRKERKTRRTGRREGEKGKKQIKRQ